MSPARPRLRPKDWLLTACALCGRPFPRGPEMYANLSRTYHSAVLPCPCETRRADDEPESLAAAAPGSLEEAIERFVRDQLARAARKDPPP